MEKLISEEIIPPSSIVVELNKANFCTIRDFGDGQKAEEWTHRTVMDSATFILCLTKAYEQGWRDRAKIDNEIQQVGEDGPNTYTWDEGIAP